MAESTITKILLRRGPESDLKIGNDATGTVLSDGEPGVASTSGTDNTYRLYIGDGAENRPIPDVDTTSIEYGSNGKLQIATNITSKIKTTNTGDGCGENAAICASDGGIYAKLNINAGGDVISYCSSDERLKRNIQIIDDPLEKLQQIRGVTFEWDEVNQQNYQGADTGLIAQEVEQIHLPGVVTTREDGYKAIKYDRLVSLLVESVKQLNHKVSTLETVVESLSTSSDGVR